MSRLALRPDRRRPGSVIIAIDGARLASVPEARLAGLGVRDGMDAGEATVERLQAVADAERAYQRAVRLLAVRARSGHELLRRLRAAGHDPRAAEEAVGRLEDAGLVDDEAFAAAFTRSRLDRGYGVLRVLRELGRRGVDRRVAERVVWQVEGDGETDADRLRRAAQRKLATMGGLAPHVRARRLAAYLARRGFGTGEILAVVAELDPRGGHPDTPDSP